MIGQLYPVILDMSHIKSSRLLNRPDVECRLDIGLPILVRYCDEKLEITVPKVDISIISEFPEKDDRFWNTFSVEIIQRELVFGYRHYFICPVSRMDCLKIVISNELLCSKTIYSQFKAGHPETRGTLKYLESRRKLLNEDGSLRMSEFKRAQLVKIIREHPGRYQTDDALIALLQKFERKEQRDKRKRLWESRALSTTKGLDCGRGANQHNLFFEMEALDPQTLLSFASLKSFEKPARDNTKYFPELDIKILIERQRLTPDGLTGVTLGWPLEFTPYEVIYMFVDPRFEGLSKLVFVSINYSTDERVFQIVELLPAMNSGKPRYFLCPITRARCEKLYLRNGVFASPQAHNLVALKD